MFADLHPPPTYCADWYMAGWPASLIVPLALTAALIAMFFYVARRDRPWRSTAALVLCVGLFVAADYVVYVIGCNFQTPWRTPRYPSRDVDLEQKKDSSDIPPQ
jgi:hypothetical protein